MAKKKKSTKKKKRVAVHIRENIKGKREAAASADGEVGADKRAPLLAAPLGVGKPKRPREPGESCCCCCLLGFLATSTAVVL